MGEGVCSQSPCCMQGCSSEMSHPTASRHTYMSKHTQHQHVRSLHLINTHCSEPALREFFCFKDTPQQKGDFVIHPASGKAGSRCSHVSMCLNSSQHALLCPRTGGLLLTGSPLLHLGHRCGCGWGWAGCTGGSPTQATWNRCGYPPQGRGTRQTTDIPYPRTPKMTWL